MTEQHIRVRRRGPNKPKKPLGKSSPAAAFARGTPIDAKTQLPPGEELLIDRKDAAGIPLDPESARVAAEHHETLTRKARGETGVRWNADGRIRYRECAMLHPNARVYFKDMTNNFDALPSTYVSACKDYDELIAFLKKNCWKGERVSYKWTIGDDTQPQWATGTINFDAAKETEMPPQGPPQGPPGYWPPPPPPPTQQTPQWGVPAYIGSNYWDGHNWHQNSSPPPPPPPPPAAPPPPPPPAPNVAPQAHPPPMSVMSGPDAHTSYLYDEIRRLHAELDKRTHAPPPPPPTTQQAAPGWYGDRFWTGNAWAPPQQPQQQQQEPVAAVAQPERPLTPIEQAKTAVQTVLDLSRLSNNLKEELTGGSTKEEDDPAPDEKKPDFPMQVQDFGPFRMSAVSENGGPPKLVEGALPFAMLNADKGMAALKGLLNQFGEFMDTRVKQSTQLNNAQTENQRRQVENAERLAAAQRTIAEAEKMRAEAEALKSAAIRAQKELEQALPPAPIPPPPAPVPPPQRPEPVPEFPRESTTVLVSAQVSEPEPEPQEEPKPVAETGLEQVSSSNREAAPSNGAGEEIEEEEILVIEPNAPILSEN